MTAPAARTMDTEHFALLDRISQRMADRRQVDDVTRVAVTLLTAAADPQRADRLAVQPGEPPALVERLAVWALRRAPDDAVSRAAQILDGDRVPPADPAEGRAHLPMPAAATAGALCTAG